MSINCLFCNIASNKIESEIIYTNKEIFAIRDISPVAPIHILVIPKKHINTINDLTTQDSELIGKMYLAVKDISFQEGYMQFGYRTIMNCNAGGGQKIFHIHLHVLSGKYRTWPP